MCPSAILGGMSLLGAKSASNASKKASATAAATAKDQMELQKGIYEETTERFQPYFDAGTNAFQAFLSEMGLGEAPEGYTGYEETPMARYLLEQSQESIPSTAAAVGGRYSGATLQSLNDRNRDIITSDQNQYLQRLFGLGQMGQNAAGNIGAAGTNFANAGSTAMGNAGNIAANAAIQQGQAIQGGITDMAGIYGYMQNPLDSYATAQNTNYSYGLLRGTPLRGTAPPARPF